MSVSLSTSTGMTSRGSANSAVTLTATGASGARVIIKHLAWSYSTAPVGNLFVSVGSNTVFGLDILSNGPGEANHEIRGGPGETITATLGAGGASVSGILNADWYYTV